MYIDIAADVTPDALRQLSDLLVSLVNSGASIGWIPPMQLTTAQAYWHDRIAALNAGQCVLLLAWHDEARTTLTGTAQLNLHQRENGRHRAEVQKVLVHLDYRRRGIARQLMHQLEACARHHDRSLLFLDTREGDPAERLYQAMGYTRVGVLPQYVRNAAGDFEATVFYYKILS